MKDADEHMLTIVRRIKERGCVLMLDFDVVLSPIRKNPSESQISPNVRSSLIECAKKIPLAIITGRPLADIQSRVGLRKIIDGGSHGLEWKMNGKIHRKQLAPRKVAAFMDARRVLLQLAQQYPRLLVEDKRLCLALGYRRLSKVGARQFRTAAHALLNTLPRSYSVRAVDNLYTFEIMASSKWTKGECAEHIYKKVARRKNVATYIGDGLTDEDAFRALAKGITIRVGKGGPSAAQYYFKTRSRVDIFLRRLAAL